MNNDGLGGVGTLYAIIVVVGFILTVLWICLPFAVFGIKRRLEDQAALLRMILTELRRQGGVGESAAVFADDCIHDFQPPYPAEISRCTKCGILRKNA